LLALTLLLSTYVRNSVFSFFLLLYVVCTFCTIFHNKCFNASVRNTWKSQGKVREFDVDWRLAILNDMDWRLAILNAGDKLLPVFCVLSAGDNNSNATATEEAGTWCTSARRDPSDGEGD